MRTSLSAWMRGEDNVDRLPWRIFWVGLILRLLYMTITHQYRIRGQEDHFQFGWECGRIARALATGAGYSDTFANAFYQHTGPTAWLPPLYPLLVAAVFKVFGVYTDGSAWVLLAINCVLSAFTAVAVYRLGLLCFNRSVAVWGGWIWALYPAAMQYAVRWIWEMTLTTALFTWVLVLTMRMRESAAPQTKRWALFGLLWGAIALSNSTLLAFLPVCGVWILWKRRGDFPAAVLAAAVFLACIAPWTVRNERVFHTFIPLRGNFGAEMYLGNGPGANGLLMEYDHPFQAPDQLRLYVTMGEVRYVAMRSALAKANIAADREHFVVDCLRRFFFFWASVPHPFDHVWLVEIGRTADFSGISLCGLLGLALAIRRGVPGAWLFFWAFVLLPLTYYFVTIHARFRHPLEPVICLLGVYLFQSADRSRLWSWRKV